MIHTFVLSLCILTVTRIHCLDVPVLGGGATISVVDGYGWQQNEKITIGVLMLKDAGHKMIMISHASGKDDELQACKETIAGLTKKSPDLKISDYEDSKFCGIACKTVFFERPREGGVFLGRIKAFKYGDGVAIVSVHSSTTDPDDDQEISTILSTFKMKTGTN